MIDSLLVRKLVELALLEDLELGDITSELTVPVAKEGRARIIARQKLVVCGLDLIELVIECQRAKIKVKKLCVDGDTLVNNTPIAELQGSLRSILALERTILNFLQRLSGVATNTRAIVKNSHKLTILDTRKTTPGWRVLEKYAVRIGGAANHRFSLGDMILVKNNHIDSAGLEAALQKVVKGKSPYMPFEVEVRNLPELQAALKFRPDIVMFDNMNNLQIRAALKLIKASEVRPLVEVSGGITPARLKELARIDKTLMVSMGGLTTQATNVDISLRIIN